MTDPVAVLQTRGVEKAARDLHELGVRARDVRGVSYKVRTVYRKAEIRRFDSAGPGWPPLAQSTVERKQRQNLDPRTLRARGTLYRSLTAPQAALQVDEREPDQFRFGTRVPYAHWHEQGKGVPERKLIDLTVNERQQIDKAITEFIAKEET